MQKNAESAEDKKAGRRPHPGGAGVSPAVAGAFRSRARAEPVLSGAKECPCHSGRDARTTVFKAGPMARAQNRLASGVIARVKD